MVSKPNLRILVCGGRKFGLNPEEQNHIHSVLDSIVPVDKYNITIIHGAATGADSVAAEWATKHNIDTDPYPVSKEDWRVYGKSAGYHRNKKMLVDGKPDLVIAFTGGNGTNMMCKIASKGGVIVKRIEWPVSPLRTGSMG